ncbi:MAG: hydrogenase nickel incorporation protein HypB [Bacteroidales bacterium]|nr:hydrogenase nickel incorporation protein HypB [Bacteroidales bacterium]MCF8402745.1 hydrogenase nickel incorporation protein HypB [Bacteroidales bacterium]
MHSHDHSHNHDHDHNHHHRNHSHSHDHGREIIVEQDILGKNNLLAERNRGFFEAKNILALNLVSSPGSGKTSLLERTIKDLGSEIDFYVIEGDQQTMNDADRINKAGAPVVQVNTGNGCHLDSDMIHKAVKELQIKNDSLLVIENVGNLVCPSLFDLGEDSRVVIISTTEGEDKPVKYPTMFETSDICIINKTDLLPYVDFDIEKCREYALKVNHRLQFFEMSVKTGEGMDKWYDWIKQKMHL